MAQIDLINIPTAPMICISVEPVRNVLNTLTLLAASNKYQNMNQFISDTYKDLDPKIIRDNEIIMHGLPYATFPETNFPGFQEYIDDLKTQDPYLLQERLFHSYDRISSYKANIISDNPVTITKTDQERILSKKQYYFEYLTKCFNEENLDYGIEEQAYHYLKKPEKMKAYIISHFQYMWDTHLKKEFSKNLSILENAVEEFNRINFAKFSHYEVIKKLTGHDIESEWSEKPWELDWVKNSKTIFFVPSIHMGPYLGRSLRENTIYIFFTPRTTEMVNLSSPDLTRTDISVRLNTLSDDTRLKILKTVARAHEMSSKEIMEAMELCQSAASRHLKQLSATGYLNERRQNSAKIYTLNKEFVAKTVESISEYLLKN